MGAGRQPLIHPLEQADANVDEMISKHPVMVFSKGYCGNCTKATAALRDAGLSPKVVEQRTEMKEALDARTGGHNTVPKVFVAGNFIGGYLNGGMGGVLPLLEDG